MRKCKAKADLTVEERERYFVNLYLKQGADESRIQYCEKRAGLSLGEGYEVLKLESVQARINDLQSLIVDTRNYQRAISEAAARKLKGRNDAFPSQQ